MKGPGSIPDDALTSLAEAAGITTVWRDVHGEDRAVGADTLRALLAAIGLPADPDEARAVLRAMADRLPPLLTMTVGPDGVAIPGSAPGHRYVLAIEGGDRIEGRLEEGWGREARLPAVSTPGYHRLTLDSGHATIAAAPPRCVTLNDLGAETHRGAAAWALAAQIYSLRRAGDGGIGDFGGVAALAQAAGRQGATALAVQPGACAVRRRPDEIRPLCALQPHHAERPPCRPDGRARRPGGAAVGGTRTRSSSTGRPPRSASWRGSGRCSKPPPTIRASSNSAARPALRWKTMRGSRRCMRRCSPATPCCGTGGNGRRNSARRRARACSASPATTRGMSPSTPSAMAGGCLPRGGAAGGPGGGMRVGLIADLAVGTDGGGSHCLVAAAGDPAGSVRRRAARRLLPAGQDWGLTAFSPLEMRAGGFGAFLELLAPAFRHAGGLRVDHAMGLQRLWVVPRGAGPAEGAYLRYPMDDLLRLLALESHRHQAIVIGEDLGTLPEGFHDRMATAGILGMRVLWFEQEKDGRFRPPHGWAPDAAAMTTTHDLPTVVGWWRGLDIGWRDRLSLFPDAATADAANMPRRDRDRLALWQAFVESGAATGAPPAPEATDAVVDAAIAHVGSAACALAILPLEDALALPEQPNLPGTVDQHPNWQRRAAQAVPGKARASSSGRIARAQAAAADVGDDGASATASGRLGAWRARRRAALDEGLAGRASHHGHCWRPPSRHQDATAAARQPMSRPRRPAHHGRQVMRQRPPHRVPSHAASSSGRPCCSNQAPASRGSTSSGRAVGQNPLGSVPSRR